METSYVNELMYKVVDNNIVGGGYPMKKFVEKENKNRNQIGGGTMCEINCSRFDDLVIPISIDSNYMKNEESISKLNKIKYHDEMEDVDFNKLLEKLGNIRKITNNSKPQGSQSRKINSKKSISNTKKHSRKSVNLKK
jgi:hypothetical protein